MKNFKNLEIWQYGFEIAKNSYQVTASFPKAENWNLISQINRAAISIPSNIEEGSSRSGEKDKNRFIEIALDSAFELETQLLISQALRYGDQEMIIKTLALLTSEEKNAYLL
jgi:four helix bundle protein